MSEQAQEALLWLLMRVGSWTNARWDAHIRHEFGDAIADEVMEAVSEITTCPPRRRDER